MTDSVPGAPAPRDTAAIYAALVKDIQREGATARHHLIAFSGGVDSALVAKAVHDAFPRHCDAVMALSPSVSKTMQDMASGIAGQIGIPLRFVESREYLDPTYVANDGRSCYICKSNIYVAMEAVYQNATAEGTLLYNGTNADDLGDPTRVGLQAAREHAVRSPLARFTKEEIRRLSRHVGLPNWNAAASPCLRSRLQIGVPATVEHLRRIESAEEALRTLYDFSDAINFRVRHLPDHVAMVEVEASLLDRIDLGRCRDALLALGFERVEKRAFRSGSVSTATDRP